MYVSIYINTYIYAFHLFLDVCYVVLQNKKLNENNYANYGKEVSP